jgi:hypothetical protein
VGLGQPSGLGDPARAIDWPKGVAIVKSAFALKVRPGFEVGVDSKSIVFRWRIVTAGSNRARLAAQSLLGGRA